jgi:hypothetical protein
MPSLGRPNLNLPKNRSLCLLKQSGPAEPMPHLNKRDALISAPQALSGPERKGSRGGHSLSAGDMVHADLATLAHLAREGSLDLSAVTLRVRTDLLLSSPQPQDDDIKSYTEFALAVLPTLGERDLGIIGNKLAAWPLTPPILTSALAGRYQADEKLIAPVPDASCPVMTEVQVPASALPEPPARADVVSQARFRNALRKDLDGRAAAIDEPDAADDAGYTIREDIGREIALAQSSLASGNEKGALALLARSDLRAADHAPFFLIASPVQQALILSGLEQLQRLQPRRTATRLEPGLLDMLMEAASTDRAGAFLGLAEILGGTPDFAAAMTLDKSRKLAGLALLAIGATVEDAVRFTIKLGDESACSVAVIFGLAETLRAATQATSLRLLRAIAGADIVAKAAPVARHVPVSDPSGTPDRGVHMGVAPQERRGNASPLDVVRKLAGS